MGGVAVGTDILGSRDGDPHLWFGSLKRYDLPNWLHGVVSLPISGARCKIFTLFASIHALLASSVGQAIHCSTMVDSTSYLGRDQRLSFVAIVGGSASGKTRLARSLGRFLGPNAHCLALDDFYRDMSHVPASRRKHLNFDSPRAIDWKAFFRVLDALKAGTAVSIPRYNYETLKVTHDRLTVERRLIVIVDGLWLLRNSRLRGYFDFSIYIDVGSRIRCARKIDRDVAERGYTVDRAKDQLSRRVLPQHLKYVQPQIKWASIRLRQPYRYQQISKLTDHLWQLAFQTSNISLARARLWKMLGNGSAAAAPGTKAYNLKK